MNDHLKIFSAPACEKFAGKICVYLKIPLGELKFKIFSDGERWCKFGENIRGRHVFLISSSANPIEAWFDLWIMIDAARRASAEEITAVVPYYRFARQERKDEPRVPITASMVAYITEFLGAHRILTMDLHAEATQGSTLKPFDHLYGSETLIKAALDQEPILNEKNKKIFAIAGDPGALKFVPPIAERHNWHFAFVDKKRRGHEQIAEEETLSVFSDVSLIDSHCIIIDDIAGTFKSLEKISDSLVKAGAKKFLL
jgi:ribose-phosphate pyrophosphokinase